MNPVRRLAAALAGLAVTLLAFAAAGPAALATVAPPPHPSIPSIPAKHPPIPAGHPPVLHVRTIVIGGMPGWQIALIAAGAALLAATLAVLADRARAARRHALITAA
jgi:hypothetical protein